MTSRGVYKFDHAVPWELHVDDRVLQNVMQTYLHFLYLALRSKETHDFADQEESIAKGTSQENQALIGRRYASRQAAQNIGWDSRNSHSAQLLSSRITLVPDVLAQ